MKHWTRLLSLTVVMALLLNSCSSPFRNELQYVEVVGTVKVIMTDAPFPYDLVQSVDMTITKVEVRANADDEPESEESPFLTIFEGEEDVDVFQLTNGITHSLSEGEVPVGSYDLVRVQVSQASVTLTDGREFDVKVPSGSQSGLKIFIKPELMVFENSTTELLLDVDLSQSLVLQGNMETAAGVTGVIFKPVIRAANLSETGTLTGWVGTDNDMESMGLEGVQISVLADDELYGTTFTDATGRYMVLGLPVGIYDVMADKDGYSSHEEIEVVIEKDAQTEVDFALTGQ